MTSFKTPSFHSLNSAAVIQQIRRCDVLFLLHKYLRFQVQPEQSAARIDLQQSSWVKSSRIFALWGKVSANTCRISTCSVSSDTHKKDTGCNNVGCAPGPDRVDEPSEITPGRRAQVSLESLSITALLVAPRRAVSSHLLACLGFKTELLFWDPSYINMQPHILQMCTRHTQTHAQIILNVYTERLKLRSDKAYLIREHSSFNQV